MIGRGQIIEKLNLEYIIKGAHLKWVNLSDANLMHASLRRAQLIEVKLVGANQYGVDWDESSLSSVTGKFP